MTTQTTSTQQAPRHPFQRDHGVVCDVQSRLAIVREADLNGLLRILHETPNLQKSVRAATRRRFLRLWTTGVRATLDELKALQEEGRRLASGRSQR